jgi:murein DD-endopeptidase MepM/ murein hydrolase activator NlpD
LAELFAEPDNPRGTTESISLTPDDQLLRTTLIEEFDPVEAAPRPEPSELSRLPEIAHALTETFVLREGDTLMNALVRTGADRGEAHVAIRAFSEVMNPRKLRVGQRLTVTFEPAGEGAAEMRLVGFALEVAPDRLVEVVRGMNGLYTAAEIQRPLEHDMVRAAGTIESSLYQAAADAGMPVPILMELIRAFSFDVDFQREIHRGDRFEILFERSFTLDGEIVSVEPLRYAALTLGGTKIELIRFEMADGRVDYFDPKGQSVRKALLRTPIDGARLTSTYGMRKHPILGYSKMHKGVDFGASKGTPIMASGSGVIDALGPNGGYGNYVRIRHNSEYSTAYAHMSAFPKGLKKGDRVEQGQVIGYVGSTGRSTGPHLHYEILKNSKQVNPLSVKLPTGEKLAGQELEKFQAARERVLTELDGLPVVTRMAQTVETR